MKILDFSILDVYRVHEKKQIASQLRELTYGENGNILMKQGLGELQGHDYGRTTASDFLFEKTNKQKNQRERERKGICSARKCVVSQTSNIRGIT